MTIMIKKWIRKSFLQIDLIKNSVGFDDTEREIEYYRSQHRAKCSYDAFETTLRDNKRDTESNLSIGTGSLLLLHSVSNTNSPISKPRNLRIVNQFDRYGQFSMKFPVTNVSVRQIIHKCSHLSLWFS